MSRSEDKNPQPRGNTLSFSWRTALLRLRKAANAGRTVLQLAGIDTGHRKVFAIGFNKTATTSIHNVFREMGLASLHKIKWRDTRRTGVFLPYNCFSDGPPDDFTILDRRFPRSKFILNIRDLDEWIDSRLEHIRLETEKGIVFENPEWSRTDSAVKHWVRARNRYHLEVLDYFRDRPEDLLVLNYIREPEPGRKIARFLGVNRDIEKPYVRSTRETRKAGILREEARIRRCLTELGVPETAWKTDIHCPLATEAPRATLWPFDSSALDYPNVIHNEDKPS